MASSLFSSTLPFLFGALTLLISGVDPKAITSVTPTDIFTNSTANDSDSTVEPLRNTTVDISLLRDRHTGELGNFTKSLEKSMEAVPIPSKVSNSNTRAPVAVTREFRPFRLSSVTQIHDESANHDHAVNVNLGSSSLDKTNSKSGVALVEKRRDLVEIDRTLPMLEGAQSYVNTTFDGICSRLIPGRDIPWGFTCMEWAGTHSLPCNSSLTSTAPADADERTIVVNALTVLKELQQLLQAVVSQFHRLPGNMSPSTDVVPLTNDHFRRLVVYAKKKLQTAINILESIEESEIQSPSNLSCHSDRAGGEKFPLGVLWKVNGHLNRVIANVRGVCNIRR